MAASATTAVDLLVPIDPVGPLSLGETPPRVATAQPPAAQSPADSAAFRRRYPMDDRAFAYLSESPPGVQRAVMESFAPKPRDDPDYSARVVAFAKRCLERTHVEPSAAVEQPLGGSGGDESPTPLGKKARLVSKSDYEKIVDEASLAAGCQPCTSTTKREDALDWDDYFMAVAKLSAMRSKDPSTQVGACIVDPEHRIVGIGYNGFPRGCSDDALPWGRTGASELDTKYPYVCHAEMNAILNKNTATLNGCTIYVALFPCNECAKLILQSGIKRVVYLSDKYHNMPFMQASRRMFDMAGIRQDLYVPVKSEIVVKFAE